MSDQSEDEHEGIPPPTIRNACKCCCEGRRRCQWANSLCGNITDADDTIKIMLATDNHIGYLERDPIRGQDSIEAFKEVLQLAVKHDVRKLYIRLRCGC